jgi:hypothetical protein
MFVADFASLPVIESANKNMLMLILHRILYGMNDK